MCAVRRGELPRALCSVQFACSTQPGCFPCVCHHWVLSGVCARRLFVHVQAPQKPVKAEGATQAAEAADGAAAEGAAAADGAAAAEGGASNAAAEGAVAAAAAAGDAVMKAEGQ